MSEAELRAFLKGKPMPKGKKGLTDRERTVARKRIREDERKRQNVIDKDALRRQKARVREIDRETKEQRQSQQRAALFGRLQADTQPNTRMGRLKTTVKATAQSAYSQFAPSPLAKRKTKAMQKKIWRRLI